MPDTPRPVGFFSSEADALAFIADRGVPSYIEGAGSSWVVLLGERLSPPTPTIPAPAPLSLLPEETRRDPRSGAFYLHVIDERASQLAAALGAAPSVRRQLPEHERKHVSPVIVADVLRVLRTQRRPASVALLGHVVDAPRASISAALHSLEAAGLVERTHRKYDAYGHRVQMYQAKENR